jgi:hypothetical protein
MTTSETLWTLGRARQFARFAHYGQKYGDDRDYVLAHVADVHRRVVTDGGTTEQEIIAYLHDSIEDWPGGIASAMTALSNLCLPDAIFNSVVAITCPPGFTRSEYYERVKRDPDALFVKQRDIESNVASLELHSLSDPERAARLERKYVKAKKELGF